MATFFNEFKKPYFWLILPIFGAIKISHTTSYSFLTPCLAKNNDLISRKHLDTDTKMKGWRETIL